MSGNHEGLRIEGRAGGPLMTVSYWLNDTATGQWALVDPTYQALQTWSDHLRKTGSAPAAIYITHGHFDHTAGAADLLRQFPGTPVWAHPDSKPMVEVAELSGAPWAGLPYEPVQVTNLYREGDAVALGETRLEVIDAPGHCPGSVLLRAGGQLIVGDVLFQGSVGRWDLPGADYDTLMRSIQKIMQLPGDTVVYPGHGPATTVGEERRYNSIVQQMLRGERY